MIMGGATPDILAVNHTMLISREKKVTLINTGNRPVTFKLNTFLDPDLSKWTSYIIKGRKRKFMKWKNWISATLSWEN